MTSHQGSPPDGRAPASRVRARPVLELTGERTPILILLGDALRHWRLLVLFARQDFQSRYRSASLGLLWSVLLPLVQAVVLAVVFSKVVRVVTTDNYPTFVLSGMAVWSYLQQALQNGSTAIVDRSDIASRVYFPRLLLPAMPATGGLVTLAIFAAITLGVALALGVRPGLSIFAALPAVALAYAVAVVFSAAAALAHVYFRDVRYLVTAALLVAFYATPVFYQLSRARGLAPLLEANPATGPIQLIRFALFGHADKLAPSLLACVGWLVVVGVGVLLAYRSRERVACDRV
ncbi:MAG: ABC transporter permease [Mycobacteriales bacterium]